jgi:hypothetical protein
MIAITTSNSMRVKAFLRPGFEASKHISLARVSFGINNF